MVINMAKHLDKHSVTMNIASLGHAEKTTNGGECCSLDAKQRDEIGKFTGKRGS